MNRREFITSTAAAGVLAAHGSASARVPPPAAPKRSLMKVGDQTAPTNETHLKYLARYSVQNICGYPEIEGDRIYATVEELNRMVDLAPNAASASTAPRLHFWSQVTSIKKSIRRSCWRKARSGSATSKPCKP